MTLNSLIFMFASGVVAAIGLATNALHLVIAAMVIAPGFEPIVRIALGLISRSASWRRGVTHTLSGYAALIIGAIATALILRTLGISVNETSSSYLPAGVLVDYHLCSFFDCQLYCQHCRNGANRQ